MFETFIKLGKIYNQQKIIDPKIQIVGFHIEKITRATANQPKASILASTNVVPPLRSRT